MKIKKFITNPMFLICISAVISALPFTFDFLYPISWVSFVPLFLAIIKNPPQKIRQMFGYGFLFGLVYHICIYYWFIWFYPLDYADLGSVLSIVVVCLAWFGISLVHGVLWCIPTMLCGVMAKRVKNPLCLSALMIVGIMLSQKITSFSEVSFPWVRISLTQYRATALIQSASLFGIDGVDIIILSVNALIAAALICPVKPKKIAAIAATGIFIANLSFGLVRLNTEIKTEESLNILTVQGSVASEDKWDYDGDKVCFETYQKLTTQNITDNTDLVLWPESAVPVEYRSNKRLKKYQKLAKEVDTPILAGILKKEKGILTNNAMLIDKASISEPYTKRMLVPFGEYMPYRQVLAKAFPFLENINVLEEDYTAGKDSALIEIKGKAVGNVICFESIYPSLARESTLDGAELLVEVTNDSWLKDSPAMKQHLAHGVFRSVENSRALVRSANSGISATIDSRGRIIKELAAEEQGVIADTVYFENEKTLYTKTGDIIFPIYMAITAILCLIMILKKKKCDS
ncbi:MAG: apolipoprotein N-acyltransferase [Clostridia bacterium]|nr:apolipoprotein N-acyltransferase [Clostridia bacterium]